MAIKQLETNLKVIQSGDVPTTTTLPEGYLSFGKIDGKPKIFGNSAGAIEEYGVSEKSVRTATLVVGFTDDCDYNITALGTTNNAQTTINAAITALPANGGKIILREGTYNIIGPIWLSSNVVLEGMGDSSIINYIGAGGGAAHGVIKTGDVIPTTGSKIKSLNIVENGVTVLSYIINLMDNCSDTTIEDVTIRGRVQGSQRAIYCSNGCDNIKIINNKITSYYGIYTLACSNMFILNNIINSHTSMYFVDNLDINYKISNNIMNYTRTGIYLMGTFHNVLGNSCRGVDSSRASGSAIDLSRTKNSVISGNIFENSLNGIKTTSNLENPNGYNSIIGNICNNNDTGISLDNYSYYNLVVGNQLYNNTTAIANSGVGTLIRANKNGATNIES